MSDNTIITVGREFGSGGRQLSRKLARELGFDYYDKEIIEQIAAHTSLSEDYVRNVMHGQPRQLLPITIGHTLSYVSDFQLQQMQSIYKAQTDIILEMAEKSSCVIVGRCADYILREKKPFRIFVCADMESRIARCLERQEEGENYTVQEIKKKINMIDKSRARYYEDFTGCEWGDKTRYDLCVNTGGKDLQVIAEKLAKILAP